MAGNDIQRSEVNSQNFMVHIHQLIAGYMLGKGESKDELYGVMTRAAAMDAFTVAKPYHSSGDLDYNRWNEPLVHQAVALTAIAQAYTLLALEFGADDQGVLAIKEWGNHLMTASDDGRDDFKGRLKGRDRAAMKAAGYAWWGHATANEAALAKAEKLLKFAMSDVKKDGSDPTWAKVQGKKDYVYYMNIEIGAVVVAAFALQRAGRADIFGRLMGRGATVEKAAQFVANMAFKEGNEIARKRSSGGTRGMAWLEFYFHQYPDSPDAANLRAQIEAANLSALYTGMLGGHTTCLVRRL